MPLIMQPKHPNRADVRLAVLRLLLLPENEADFTKDDYDFLCSDLAGKILKYWPSELISLTSYKKSL